jgi:hypothetical protein
VPYTLIIDEFQDFDRVNPAIFSDIQNLWDQYKDKVHINFIACGSIYSLMMKIFENGKEPLFGRITSKIVLHPFHVKVIKKILQDNNPHYAPDDLLCFYLVTGGVPKYVSLLINAGAVTKELIFDAITAMDSLFLHEGRDLLISEFGKEYGTYFSILQLIANGKNTQSEIDSIIEKNTGTYLTNLEKEYSLIEKNKPMFSKPGSRNTHWKISDHYLRFYFRFIFPNQALIELGKSDVLRKIIEEGYAQYSGLVLEDYFRAKIAQAKNVTAIGSYWDKKGENEIDLIACNDIDKIAFIAEVKREKEKINMQTLAFKTSVLQKDLAGYTIQYKGYSLSDM